MTFTTKTTTTIFATALLVAGSTTTASAGSLRRNRLYDVTGEFGRFDESDPAFENLFRELAQDDIKMGFQNSMSYGMSMDTTPAPIVLTSAPSSSTANQPSSAPSTSPAVPTSPTSSPTPINNNYASGSPTIAKTTTDIPTTNVGGNGCALDPTTFQNDPSVEVFLKIDVDTLSASTGFLDDLMDAILATLQNEFGLCLLPTNSGSSRRTLAARTTRQLEDGDTITGVTLGITTFPSDQSCEAMSDGNTCHVVYSSVVVYGTNQLVVTEGASNVVPTLQEQDFAEGDIADVRVAERGDDDDDGDKISNGVSDGKTELDVETTVSSSSTGSSTGLAVALSLIAAALIAIAVVVLSRRMAAEDDSDVSGQSEPEGDDEESGAEDNKGSRELEIEEDESAGDNKDVSSDQNELEIEEAETADNDKDISDQTKLEQIDEEESDMPKGDASVRSMGRACADV